MHPKVMFTWFLFVSEKWNLYFKGNADFQFKHVDLARISCPLNSMDRFCHQGMELFVGGFHTDFGTQYVPKSTWKNDMSARPKKQLFTGWVPPFLATQHDLPCPSLWNLPCVEEDPGGSGQLCAGADGVQCCRAGVAHLQVVGSAERSIVGCSSPVSECVGDVVLTSVYRRGN